MLCSCQRNSCLKVLKLSETFKEFLFKNVYINNIFLPNNILRTSLLDILKVLYIRKNMH